MDKIAKLIRDFLWRGGKGNHNRMHLVKWDVVKRPILEGGLQTRDPELVNLAMGGKLLWKLFSDKKHPVSQIFWKKYLKGGSLRNIQMTNIPKVLFRGIYAEISLPSIFIVFQEMVGTHSCGMIKLMVMLLSTLIYLLLRLSSGW